jgi:DGQHR domain-containing protein
VVPGSGIGVLRLPLDAHLRSIDGQHRREGLRQSISSVPDLQKQSTAALIYVEPDLAQRRQMFSDMNNTARKVSKALNVSYDSRDAFARAAARVSSEHFLLAGRVERAGARVVPGSGNLYTLAAVYDALKRLFVGPVGRVKDSTKFNEGEIVARGIEFFDALAASRAELDPSGSAESLDQLRTESILLSSTTLRVLASAVWTAGEDIGDMGAALRTLGRALRQVDFSPSAAEWQESGFVSPGRSTPNARSQEMRTATNRLAAMLSQFTETDEGVAK